MKKMSDSRESILNTISNSLRKKPESTFEPYSGFDNNDYLTINYNTDLLTEFSQKLESLSGNVKVVKNKRNLSKSVTDIFSSTNSNNFIGWECVELSSVYRRLEKLGYKHIKSNRKSQQAKCDIGITLADYAISESGTIVLYNNKTQNRNSSLIVPIHIAILRKEKIVKSIFDLIARLSNDYSTLENINELSNCITLITGPSRTADIELNLTLGVHGPKELYVVVM